ncbi:hypothetical protein KP509_31G002400 [Ceratopteris richardii]|nr:hypothetical protein KP509_31G002400 [Ceratopteris richardii]
MPDEIQGKDLSERPELLDYLRQKTLSLPEIEELEHLLHHSRKKYSQALALQLYDSLCEIGLEAYPSLGNHLVVLFSELLRVDIALKVFKRLAYHTAFSWNSLVIGYGDSDRALILYQKLLKENADISFSSYTFVVLLKTCAKLRDSQVGIEVHADIVRMGLLETDVFIGSALVDMYAKCGLLTRSQEVFDYLPVRDIVLWNALITAYANYEYGDRALHCFEKMQLHGFFPKDVTFVSTLKACTCMRDLRKGQQLHSRIKMFGLPEKNIVIGNVLIDMYIKCGALVKAHEVFERLEGRDVVSWNTLIMGYVEYGCDEEAIDCLDSMQHCNIIPDAVTFICGLKACGNLENIEKGQEIHVEIERKGLLKTDLVVGNALVDMYSRCGILYRAHEMIHSLPLKSTVTWNTLIAGYIDHGYNEKAVKCFMEMQLNPSTIPDGATLVSTLKACGSMGMQGKVIEIHVEAERRGFVKDDLLVGSTLVDAYAKCGSLSKSEETFERLQVRGIVAWTSLILGYIEHGYEDVALDCLQQMHHDGLSPDAVTYACILKACGNIKDSKRGQEIHREIDRLGLLRSDQVVVSALIDMYVKCSMLEKAREVFNKLHIRDAVTWNTLIKGYIDNEQSEEAIELYEQMQSENICASNVTYICILKACSNLGDIKKAEEIYAEISRIELLYHDPVLGNTLLDMYAKFGLLQKAQEVFDNIHTRDVVSWNALLTGYVEHGHPEEALNCFEQMEHDGVHPDNITLIYGLKACGSIGAIPKGCDIHAEIERLGLLETDISVGSNLVDMYGRLGEVERAQEVFDELRVQDVVAWTSLLGGYAENGYDEAVIGCIDEMQFAGINPDAFTFTWGLKACSSLGATDKGREIHAEIERRGLLERDLILGNVLLDSYVKFGLVAKAQQVFEKLPVRDVISWNSLIAGYAQLGESENAFCVLDGMLKEGLKPGPVTFTILLSACNRVGLLEKGQSYFELMSKDHGINPMLEQYTCMVELLGRGGKLDQATVLMKNSLLSADLAAWHAFLTSCTRMGDIKLGTRAFEQAMHLNKQHASSYVLISKLLLDNKGPTM